MIRLKKSLKITYFFQKYYSKCHLYLYNWSVAPSFPASSDMKSFSMEVFGRWQKSSLRSRRIIKNWKSKLQIQFFSFDFLTFNSLFWVVLTAASADCWFDLDVSRSDLKWNEIYFLGQKHFPRSVNMYDSIMKFHAQRFNIHACNFYTFD